MLEPSEEILDRHTIAGPLLDQIFELKKIKAKAVIAGMHATLAIVGWSTMTCQPVICVCILVLGKGYLIETIDTTGDPRTAEFLVDLLKLKIEHEKTWNVKVSSVVTDRTANMSAMRTIIKSRNPALHVYGCHAYIANLLAKDIRQEKKGK